MDPTQSSPDAPRALSDGEDGFSLAWLSMREPFDHQARDIGLLDRLTSVLPPRALRVVDLGCGHGNNLRFLQGRLPHPQSWTAIDHDPRLLDWLEHQGCPAGVQLTCLQRDLRAGLDSVPWNTDLVVTSALLDLVSDRWLADLAGRCARHRVPVLAVLSVDGRVDWDPFDPDDVDVMRWFRAHQTTDRGFGPSPGPQAAERFAALLEAQGMTAWTARSDWRIPATAGEMLDAMVRGIAHASAECSGRPATVQAWLDRRLASIQRGAVSLRVGHTDVLGLPG